MEAVWRSKASESSALGKVGHIKSLRIQSQMQGRFFFVHEAFFIEVMVEVKLMAIAPERIQRGPLHLKAVRVTCA